MKRLLTATTSAAVVAAMFALNLPQTNGQDMDLENVPSITVTGQGEVSVRPDLVRITLGVETNGERAGDVLRDNSQAMQQLFDSLERNGIERKNIQTSDFSINPIYNNQRPPRGGGGIELENQQPRIVGYRISNRVRISSSKLDELGTLLDSLVQDGANSVYGIEFDVSDPKTAQDSARIDAIKEARRKAELLAEAAGASIGRPLKITEQQAGNGPVMMQARMMMADSAVPIAEGEQKISASVTVTYQLTEKS